MISICFKSLNKKTIINLENTLENINLKNIIYVERKFKTYYNLIIHFRGTNINMFYTNITNLFRIFILDNYEERIYTSHLKFDFFYFSSLEQNEIKKRFNDKLLQEDIQNKKNLILDRIIYSYIINSKKIYVDGFINFRLYDYKKYLIDILENEIHEYVVEKEYTQYADLLRDYINEKINNNESQSDLIHLFYFNTEKNILDEKFNLITTTSSKKFLSDISFSENDFILNSILSLVPKKLIIHTNNNDNNFITFLKSIFSNKCILCKHCDHCTPQILNSSNKKNN